MSGWEMIGRGVVAALLAAFTVGAWWVAGWAHKEKAGRVAVAYFAVVGTVTLYYALYAALGWLL